MLKFFGVVPVRNLEGRSYLQFLPEDEDEDEDSRWMDRRTGVNPSSVSANIVMGVNQA